MENNQEFKKIDKSEYAVDFDFTTFDTKKSIMRGRQGQIIIWSVVPMEDISTEEVKQLCVNQVLTDHPNWNILMLDVKRISPYKPKLNKIHGK